MTDPDIRHGPLEDLHGSLGAKLGPFAGWLMPIEYRGVLSEHRAVRERVGLFDLSHLGKVDVVGASAFGALQGLFTNDLRKVEVGRAQYHHLLNDRGGVEEDLFVYRLGDERWFLVPNAANKDKVVSAVRPRRGREAVDHDDWCFLGVQGPRSHAVVSKLWRTAVELAFRGCRSRRLEGDRGRSRADRATRGTGVRAVRRRCDRGRSVGRAHDGRAALRHRAVRARRRATCSASRWVPALRAGPRSDRTTLEAGLGWAVSFDKGPFVGREALERQRDAGLPSLLRGLRDRDRRQIPRAHHPVIAGDRTAGEVTSGTYSPLLGHGIAHGLPLAGGCVRAGDRGRDRHPWPARARDRRADAVRRPFAALSGRYSSTGAGTGVAASIMSATEDPLNSVRRAAG